MARRERIVITDREPPLLEVLRRFPPTDNPDAVVHLPRRREVEGIGGPVVPLVAEQRFVGAEGAVIRMLQSTGDDVALEAFARRWGDIGAAELIAEAALLILETSVA